MSEVTTNNPPPLIERLEIVAWNLRQRGLPNAEATVQEAIAALRYPGAAEMREALTRYIDTQKRLSAHGSDYWMALNNVQGALNALPAPEVPDEVREWARYIDSGQLGTNTAPARALREYYRKEYGI